MNAAQKRFHADRLFLNKTVKMTKLLCEANDYLNLYLKIAVKLWMREFCIKHVYI